MPIGLLAHGPLFSTWQMFVIGLVLSVGILAGLYLGSRLCRIRKRKPQGFEVMMTAGKQPANEKQDV